MTHLSLPTIALVLISTLLTACGTTGTKDSMLPKDLKPMSEIYKEHFGRGKAASEHAPAPTARDGGSAGNAPGRMPKCRECMDARERPGAVFQPHDMTLPKSHDTKLHGTLRVAATALDHTFPRLANPTLVMTIYPHLAGPSGAPVPGYATRFTLYDKVEYALPGEFAEGPSQ